MEINTQWTLPAPPPPPCGPAVYKLCDLMAALPASEQTIKTWIRTRRIPRPANFDCAPRAWFWPKLVWDEWEKRVAKKLLEA